MDLKKVNNFLVKFWLVLGIGTAIYGAYYVYQFGLEGNVMYLLLPLVAFFFYGLRRSMANRMNKQSKEDA